ncbi:MAG: hypothetical protein WC465_03340 [Patescibacteria group bacterium]
MLSCYEGTSFRDLARHVTFDKTGKVLKLNGYLARPRRFVLIAADERIAGVMVTISLPEFYKEIDYEDYAVIDTQTISGYERFLDHLSFGGRAEIVTFDANQVKSVKSRFPIRGIHHWTVFASQGKTSTRSVNAVLMDRGDLKIARELAQQVPEESSPFRLLMFQLRGLPYRNYAFSYNGRPAVFVGICPYSRGVYQVNYFIRLSGSTAFSLAALESISRLVKTERCRLIWRLRKKEVLKNKVLIARSSFGKLTDEQHLHLK